MKLLLADAGPSRRHHPRPRQARRVHQGQRGRRRHLGQVERARRQVGQAAAQPEAPDRQHCVGGRRQEWQEAAGEAEGGEGRREAEEEQLAGGDLDHQDGRVRFRRRGRGVGVGTRQGEEVLGQFGCE